MQVVKLLGIIGNAACRLQLALSADCQPGSLSWRRSLFHSPLPAVTRLSSTRSADEDHTHPTHPAHSHMQAGTVSEAQSVSAVLCVIGKSGKRKSRLAKHNAYRPCGMKGGRGATRGRLMCLIKLSRREQLAQLAKQIATRQVEWVEQ